MRKFNYLKYYNFKDSLILMGSLVIDYVYQKLPKSIFRIKNIHDVLRYRGARVTREDNEMIIYFDSICYRLRLRGSDIEVFEQIVLREELKTLVSLASELKKDRLHIVDCGANIGLASLTFKKHFPDAKVICLEPEPGNYSQLSKNIAGNKFTDVTLVNGGVWHRETTLAPDYDFRDKSNWSFALKEHDRPGVPGISVSSPANIAAKNNWEHIDILKIDIEGSEFDLFRNLHTWRTIFDTVKIVSIEVHPEKGDAREIENILLESGFHLRTSGELLIGVKK